MSGVRLSPGSPGVERVSRTPGSPRTPARRCLFGPAEPLSLAREVARFRAEQEEQQRARWNFDFRNDRPLDGALQWEEAGPDTPEFYRREPHVKAGESRGKKRSAPHSGETAKLTLTLNGEPPSTSSSQTSHRSEDGETSLPPEQTPKKSRPTT